MRLAKQAQSKALIPTASMADIAFLLIIFFMVCSRFAKDPGVKIDPPTTRNVSQLDDFPMVVLIDEKGNLYFQGQKVAGHEQIEEEDLFETIMQKFDVIGRDKLALHEIDKMLDRLKNTEDDA